MRGLFLFFLVFFSAFCFGQVQPPTSKYTPVNSTGYNWLRGFFRSLGISPGDTILQSGQWNGAGQMVYRIEDSSFYLWNGSRFERQLNLRDTSKFGTSDTLLSKKVDTIYNKIPLLNQVPITAYRNVLSYDLQSANKYVRENTIDTNTISTSRPDTIFVSETKELIEGIKTYNALPALYINNNTLLLAYQHGTSHATNSSSAIIRSTDFGKTWSNQINLNVRQNGSDYKTPTLWRSGNSWYSLYDNGISNTLGRSPRKPVLSQSTDDGATWTVLDSLDLTGSFAYRVTTSCGRPLTTKSGTLLHPIYGLDANNTDFRGGILRTTNNFSTYTYIPWTQTPSTHKFNEIGLFEKGDTVFAYIRSEVLTGTFLYLSYSVDDGLSWTIPSAVTFPQGTKTMPYASLLPDGRVMLFMRENSTTQRGLIYVSDGENYLSLKRAGYLYNDAKPFMYGSGVIIGDKLAVAYGMEDSNIPFSGGKCGIYIATIPVYSNAVFYKQGNKSTILTPLRYDVSLSNKYNSFTADLYSIKGSPYKKVSSYSLNGDKDVTGLYESSSLLSNILHRGSVSASIPSSSNLSAPLYSKNIYSLDSTLTITGNGANAIVAPDGFIYLAPEGNIPSYIHKINPISKDTTRITGLPNSVFINAMAAEGDTIYLMSSTATLYKLNIKTNGITTYSLGSSGWNGLSIVNGNIYTVKSSSNNQIAKYSIATGTHTFITTPSTGAWVTGPYDGRYQWFLAGSTLSWLKLDPTNDAVEEIGRLLPITGMITSSKYGAFTGKEIVTIGATGNTVFALNPVTLEGRTVTLPSGTYPSLIWDGISIWAVNRTAANLIKINEKDFSYSAIPTAHGGQSNKFYGGFFYDNKIWLYPSSAGKFNIIQPTEFENNDIKRIYTTKSQYSAGGYDVLVRNQKTGKVETTTLSLNNGGGAYFPTTTVSSNITAYNNLKFTWTKNSNIYTISGQIDIAADADVLHNISITLPDGITTVFGSYDQVSGSGSSLKASDNTMLPVFISANNGSSGILLRIKAPAGDYTISFVAQFEKIEL